MKKPGYSKTRICMLAGKAAASFEQGDESNFFDILDGLTRSKPDFDLIRTFGEELGKSASKDPARYFELFDKIMHRDREKSYDSANLSAHIRKSERNINALIYGGRVALIGSAFTQMREKHWKHILKIIEAWNVEFSDWYVVDSWCHHPMAHIIAEHQEEMIPKLREWSESESFWFRKAVPVYLHAFLTDYEGFDISPFLAILDNLMLDQENWVAKGMGWCLREMAKNYPDQLFAFLERWSGVRGIKPVIFSEAVKKLSEERRNLILERFNSAIKA